MKKVDIYTDGSCSGNPGRGGWCAILIYKGVEKVISGGEENTTNNRMELYAIVQGLRALKEWPCDVTVYSDSAYAINAFRLGWIDRWQKTNWISNNKEIKNRDIWESLLIEVKKHRVNFVKVKGHSDNEYNNRCDKVARQESMPPLSIND